MKRKVSAVALAAVLLPSAAFAQADLRAKARSVFEPIPSVLPAVKNNAVTHEKVELGRMLFFDPRLSRSQVISCNSCHNLGTGGADNIPTSIGHGWQRGPRNAPTVLNSVLNIAQFWDGRAEDLKAQAKGPIQASVEMNNTPDRVVAVLKSIPEYQQRFKTAFPNEPDPVSFDNVAKAIEAFEATLLTRNAPFDRYLEGNADALSAQQKQGLQLFIERGCAGWHNGINIGGGDYRRFGEVERPE